MKEGWGKIKKKRKSGEERNSQADRPVQYIKQLDWCTHTHATRRRRFKQTQRLQRQAMHLDYSQATQVVLLVWLTVPTISVSYSAPSLVSSALHLAASTSTTTSAPTLNACSMKIERIVTRVTTFFSGASRSDNIVLSSEIDKLPANPNAPLLTG